MKYLIAICLLMSLPANANDLPQKSIAELKGYDQNILGQAGIVKPKDMLTYGAVIDGVHYVAGCRTGTNCDDLILPSYSIAKSIMAGLTLMRLENLYPGAKNQKIADFIPACKKAGWTDVTFESMLDMASGHYITAKSYEDEKKVDIFLTKPTNREKTDFSCATFPKKDRGGKTWVYRTMDTWLLGVAMQNFWRKKQQNPKADFYTDLIEPLWKNLGLSDQISTARGEGRQPYAGTEMFFVRGDIAKIAHALATKDEKLTSKLDSNMLKAAMQNSSSPKGLIADNPKQTYKNGFWGYNAGAYLKCEADLWIPFMSGYGGKTVLMLPTGDVYYYFSDGHVYRFAEVIGELHKHRPICKSSSSAQGKE